MTGKLILITGRSASGKTTLLKGLLSDLQDVFYLETYTTRVKRAGDIGYKYVTREEYLQLMKDSKQWNHTENYGESYGIDVEQATKKAGEGKCLIFACFPSSERIEGIKSIFPLDIKTIYIDVPREVSFKRLKADRHVLEGLRVIKEDFSITPEFLNSMDYTFNPRGDIEKDKVDFNELIQKIVST